MWIVTGKAAGIAMMDVVNMDNMIDIYTIDNAVVTLPVQGSEEYGTITLGRYQSDDDADAAIGLLFARLEDAAEHRRKYIAMPTVRAAHDATEKMRKEKEEKNHE